MKIKRYVAADMRNALRAIREEQGRDAVILSSRPIPQGVEVCAAVDLELAAGVLDQVVDVRGRLDAREHPQDAGLEVVVGGLVRGAHRVA